MIRIVYALSVLSAIFLSGCDNSMPQTVPFSLAEANSVKLGDSKESVLSKISTPYHQSNIEAGKAVLSWMHYDQNPDATAVWSFFVVRFSKEDGTVEFIKTVPPCQSSGGFQNRGINHCPVIIKRPGKTYKTTILKSMYFEE